ncbi:hypothetical protein F3K31_22685 [Escherichia coli]|nr:hypothetical protein F3K31_22685 [Escherichia coli]
MSRPVIYIYDEIGFWGVTAKQFISDLNALGDITHINLHINSPGGDVFEGIAIFNALKTHGASITVYVDGVAASMASVIAMVGNPVIMPENTFMMIHKPFGFTGGDAEDMRTYADLLDKVEAVLLPAYAQKTGKTTDEIAAMLADETWMSGAECLAHGFADQVTPAVKAMACIQSKRTEEFKKMPESIRNMITPPRNSAPRVQDDEPAASRTPVQAAAPVVDENSIRAQVLAEQKARVMAFRMSEQPRTIKIYNLLAGTNEFIGEGDAYIPPHTGLPANSTDIAPPDIPAGFVAVFNSDESSWHLVEDHRGKTVYDVASGNALFISELGPLPENVTWLSPEGEFQKWNGTAWVKDTEAEKLFRIREAEETKNSLMQAANEHIAPLQDAVDLEIATEEENSLLEAWKKYRVLLNRVNTTTAPDIEWPVAPIG